MPVVKGDQNGPSNEKQYQDYLRVTPRMRGYKYDVDGEEDHHITIPSKHEERLKQKGVNGTDNRGYQAQRNEDQGSSDCHSAVIRIEDKSGTAKIQKGTKQGCPMSPINPKDKRNAQ